MRLAHPTDLVEPEGAQLCEARRTEAVFIRDRLEYHGLDLIEQLSPEVIGGAESVDELL